MEILEQCKHHAIMEIAKGMWVVGYTSQKANALLSHGATTPERGEAAWRSCTLSCFWLLRPAT